MSYCTAADIEAMNAQRKQTFGAATTPTLTQVNDFIDEIAAEIDAILSAAGASVPVSPASDYLKLINKMGAAAMVEAAKQMEGVEESTEARNYRQKRYDRMLDMLAKNPELSGATITTGQAGSVGSRSDATSDYSNPNMTFQGDGTDW